MFESTEHTRINFNSFEACWIRDIPRLLWKATEDGSHQLPPYYFILIDEAQFFAPLWMRLLQKALVQRSGNLFLVADPTQGFLGRGASWRSLGLDARGHTHHLRKSYRTTREIMQFATVVSSSA